MPKTDEWLSAIADYVRRLVADEKSKAAARHCTAKWISAETTDANLSRLQFPNGSEVRYVAKAKGLTFTAGDIVVCIDEPNMPLFIIAIWSGNITATGA